MARRAVWRSWCQAPRWQQVPEALRISAQEWRLTIDRLDVEKRLLVETVVFEISGPEDRLRRFAKMWRALSDA